MQTIFLHKNSTIKMNILYCDSTILSIILYFYLILKEVYISSIYQ